MFHLLKIRVPPLSNIDEVLVALRRVIRATDLHSKYLVKTTGLTAPQILLLQTIRDKGQITIGEIANEMNLSQATVTTIFDRLDKRNLTYRVRSKEDKRKVHAHLTQHGLDTLANAPTPLQDHFARQFKMLQDWEQSMILSSIQRVANIMATQDIDPAPVLEVGKLNMGDAFADAKAHV